MIISWNWLKEYVRLDVPLEEFQRRMMLAGLNHEETVDRAGDAAIDLEITSNRPDCLGHIGIAREAAVLWQLPLQLPPATPREGAPSADKLTSAVLESPELCPRYTARVIRGAEVRPSPDWLVRRLETIGIAPINNIVDITNYVLMECGQPLHAFDLAKLAERRIIVRHAKPGEQFLAINHKTYTLEPDMCVIADAKRAVALGGVMGGAETEVAASTTDILLEAAQFDPISIRATARRLGLHSDSSYRFERGLDPDGVDWASRRACELILDLAGGELASGMVDVGQHPKNRAAITLRLAQLKRILGIEIDPAEVRRILEALGNRVTHADKTQIVAIPPSWRRDLRREIDLVEEVARIHGYDEIPEDVGVAMITSSPTHHDRVLAKVREMLVAAGFDEAMTLSIVEEDWSEAFSPWTNAPPLKTQMPILRRADRLRRSLVPSLLGARRTNESLANPRIELFEIAKVYLAHERGLPDEQWMLSLTSGHGYLTVKGAIESIVGQLNPDMQLVAKETQHELLVSGRAAELWIGDELFGYLGEVSDAGLKQFELRSPTTIAEVRVAVLEKIVRLIPQYKPLSTYPAVDRDLNLVVDENVQWADVAGTIREAAGPELESLEYKDTYRDPQRLGQAKKSLLLSLSLRSQEGTLTNEQADMIRDRIVQACQKAHGAQLRA